MNKWEKSLKIVFYFSFLLLVLTRLLPYLKNRVPLGYDPGFYLYIFQKYFEALPFLPKNLDTWATSFPPGLFLLADLFFILGVTPEKLLLPLFFAFQILLFWAVYKVIQGFNKNVAYLACFLFAASPIQFRTYWWMYYKNVPAMAFMLFFFYFLSRKSFWAIFFGVLTAYFHRATFFLLTLVFLTQTLLDKRRRTFYLKVAFGVFSLPALYYLPTFSKTVLPLLRAVAVGPSSAGGGTFYDLSTSLKLALPYFPFALLGLSQFFRQEKIDFLTLSFLFSFLIVFLKLFFFNRFIIFLDLFLIIFAAFGLKSFLSYVSSFLSPKVFLSVFWLSLTVLIFAFVIKTGKPLISLEELEEIQHLKKTEKEAFVLATSREYTPWLIGYSGRRIIAPGFGDYDKNWTRDDWHLFWSSHDRVMERMLLQRYQKPLYIFVGDNQPEYNFDVSDPLCFSQYSPRVYKFICQ